MAGTPLLRFDGFFVREDVDGSLARMSGTSQYIRFYPDARIVRLYVPYPRSTGLSNDLVRLVFDAANRATAASAYLRDDFGILDEAVVVHLDKVQIVNDRALFDCGLSAPCEVLLDKDGMALISPGLVREHRVEYRLVAD